MKFNLKENNQIWVFSAYLVILIIAFIRLRFIGRQFIGHYDIDSIVWYLLGSSLDKYGFVNLKFIPVLNSGPLTKPPDYYIHWPFLYPYMLGFLFKIFGPSVYIGRFLTDLFSTISSWILYHIMRKISNYRFAFFTTFIYCIAPASLYYGFWVGRNFIAICFYLAAISALISYILSQGEGKDYLTWTCIFFALAGFVSWEPVVTISGFALLFYVYREAWFRKTLILCTLTLILVFLIHHFHILLVCPGQLWEHITNAMYRANITGDTKRPFYQWLFMFAWNWCLSFGPIIFVSSISGLFLLAFNWKDQILRKVSRYSLQGYRSINCKIILFILFFFMPLTWFLVMPKVAFYHDFEFIFWLPLVALVSGYLIDFMFKKVGDWNQKWQLTLLITLLLIICFQSYFGFERFYKEINPKRMESLLIAKKFLKETDILVQFGWAPDTAYYTERHVISITDKDELLRASSKPPTWVTGVFFISEDKNNYLKQSINTNNTNNLLNWGKKIFRNYYKPLSDIRNKELYEWIEINYPLKYCSSGILLYDLNNLVDRNGGK